MNRAAGTAPPRVPRVTVKETLVRHASDLIRWLDGTSSPDLEPVTMLPLDRPLAVEFDVFPSDLRWLHRPGSTALWRRPTTDVVTGEASEAERTRPALALFRVAGRVADPSGAYNPRTFDLTLGDGRGLSLPLYPSPQGTRFGGGGGLIGALRYDAAAGAGLAGRPAAWALVEVSVTVGALDLRRFRAQCDAKGDLRLSLWRLPPLPQGTAAYAAELRVQVIPAAAGRVAPDPAAAVNALAAGSDPGEPAEVLPLSLVPGRIHRLESAGLRHLAVRPAPVVP